MPKVYHREKCESRIRAIVEDNNGNKIIITGKHAFEWNIVRYEDGKLVITTFPNRIACVKEVNKLKHN